MLTFIRKVRRREDLAVLRLQLLHPRLDVLHVLDDRVHLVEESAQGAGLVRHLDRNVNRTFRIGSLML